MLCYVCLMLHYVVPHRPVIYRFFLPHCGQPGAPTPQSLDTYSCCSRPSFTSGVCENIPASVPPFVYELRRPVTVASWLCAPYSPNRFIPPCLLATVVRAIRIKITLVWTTSRPGLRIQVDQRMLTFSFTQSTQVQIWLSPRCERGIESNRP